MNLYTPNSSFINSVGYDDTYRTLHVGIGNASYRYHDVPRDVWTGLQRANSTGSYFTSNVRDQYAYHVA